VLFSFWRNSSASAPSSTNPSFVGLAISCSFRLNLDLFYPILRLENKAFSLSLYRIQDGVNGFILLGPNQGMDAGLKSQADSNGEVPMQMMRVDRQLQSCAPACSRIGARARVGLVEWGSQEAGWALCQGGLPSEAAALWGGIFGRSGSSFIIS